MVRRKEVVTAPIPSPRKRPSRRKEPPAKRLRTSLTSNPANEIEDDLDEELDHEDENREQEEEDEAEDEDLAVATSARTTTPASRSGNRFEQNHVSTPSLIPKGIGDMPSRTRRADRSARRKSARTLIARVVGGEGSDDDEGDEEDMARAILDSSASEDEEDAAEEQDGEKDQDAENQEAADAADTPSKRPRGRQLSSGTKTPKKGRKAKSSPSPPRDLPPHEQFFLQNKPGTAKTSGNTLAGLDVRPLTHDEYFSVLRAGAVEDQHAADVAFLESLHARSFPQWAFELAQGFGLCVYGYGSKKRLLMAFATYLHRRRRPSEENDKTVVVNGYLRTLTPRDVLTAVATALDPSRKKLCLGGTATAATRAVLSFLSNTPSCPHITLFVHSIDGPGLRRPGAQAVLAALAAHPHVGVVASADTADFPALWDASARAAFGWAFHDGTTFAPRCEAEWTPVDDVHELLGRGRGRGAVGSGGREGVAFVLRSLPENARNLFRLLVGEVLVALGEEQGAAAGDGSAVGIEYRMLYNKAVEDFICSSEMAFRTLLKEFHDHQMIESRKDAIGTELLSLPFDKEELEGILEDLTS